MESKTKPFWASKWYVAYLILMVAIVGIWLYARYCMHIQIVVGESMYPTYKNEDVLQCETHFKKSDIKRGDVVVISVDDIKIVKRVVGLPGEALCVKNGQICIKTNGVTKSCGYDFDPMEDYGVLPTSDQPPLYLTDNQFFCVGDNRNESVDSREYGPFEFEKIEGIVIKKITNI